MICAHSPFPEHSDISRKLNKNQINDKNPGRTVRPVISVKRNGGGGGVALQTNESGRSRPHYSPAFLQENRKKLEILTIPILQRSRVYYCTKVSRFFLNSFSGNSLSASKWRAGQLFRAWPSRSGYSSGTTSFCSRPCVSPIRPCALLPDSARRDVGDWGVLNITANVFKFLNFTETSLGTYHRDS